jgi:hypothetical protein
MIPKTWTDAYGDTIKKTSQEISECLNAMVDNRAKIDGELRKALNKAKSPKKPKKKWNKNKNKKNNGKWKNQPKLSPEAWAAKQAARKQRLANM